MFIDVAPRKALLGPDGIFSRCDLLNICMQLPKATMKYCMGLHFYAGPVILRLVAGKCSTELRALRVSYLGHIQSGSDSLFVGDVVDKT